MTSKSTSKRIELAILSAQTKLAMYGELEQPLPENLCKELAVELQEAYNEFKALVNRVKDAVA